MMATAHIELPQLKLKQEMVLVVLIACSLFSFSLNYNLLPAKVSCVAKPWNDITMFIEFSSIETIQDDSYQVTYFQDAQFLLVQLPQRYGFL
jgi:hypothetical protein